jgi:peptide chain release factor 2
MWEPVSAMAENVGSTLELAQMASESDVPSLQVEADKLAQEWTALEGQLYLSGEFDQGNAYLTISAGAGGTEAQDWASMLARMYMRYCERQGWKTTMLDRTDGAEAGVKTVTFYVEGHAPPGQDLPLRCQGIAPDKLRARRSVAGNQRHERDPGRSK